MNTPPNQGENHPALLDELNEGADDTLHRAQSARHAANHYGLTEEEALEAYGLTKEEAEQLEHLLEELREEGKPLLTLPLKPPEPTSE